jgi:protein SCO1
MARLERTPKQAMARYATRFLIATGLLAALVSGAAADPDGKPARGDNSGETIVPPPPVYQGNGVTVDEHLGAKLPLDAKFRTHEGKLVTLGEVLAGDLPTILTFNYSSCPMLCSQQLNGLTRVMPEAAKPGPAGADKDLALVLGEHYRIVTISLEPNETLERLNRMRTHYLERVNGKQDAKWTYLVAETAGDDSAIRRVAQTVGFQYTYIDDRAEWAHPAAFIFLSSAGAITRYLYGIEFEPQLLRETIYKAGIAESSTSVGFMFRCYHYDPAAKDHSRAGVLALRIGAASAIAVLAVIGVFAFRRRKSSSPQEVTS